jgi:S1-C subfamily serine protease
MNEPAWGRVVARDRDADLALIETKLRPAAVAKLRGASDPPVGERVLIAGFRGARQDLWAYVAEGKVTRIPAEGDGLVFLSFAGHVESGMSGGPLLDSRGQVAGVNFVRLETSEDGEVNGEFGYAIHTPTVRRFLAKHGVPYAAGSQQQSTAADGEATAAIARQITVRVFCVANP